jgi:hypothetical protein
MLSSASKALKSLASASITKRSVFFFPFYEKEKEGKENNKIKINILLSFS